MWYFVLVSLDIQ